MFDGCIADFYDTFGIIANDDGMDSYIAGDRVSVTCKANRNLFNGSTLGWVRGASLKSLVNQSSTTFSLSQ